MAIALFSYRRNAYISHDTVLVFHDLVEPKINRFTYRNFDSKYRPIHILTNDTINRNDNVILHETNSIKVEQLIAPQIGIPRVSIYRAFIDATSFLTNTELDFALEKAISKDFIDPKRLMKEINAAPNGRGRQKKRLRLILKPYLYREASGSIAESKLEKRVQRVIENKCNLKCTPQFEVFANHKRYRLDYAIPDRKIAIEVDGFAYHRNRSQFDNDRVRQNELSAIGWKFVRITSSFKDEDIVKTIFSLLHSPF